MSDMYESIDNELSTIPYQSMSNRTKRYLKRNIMKIHLYNKPQNMSLIYNCNYNIIYFLTFYFIISSVYFMASFFSKTP